MRTPSSAIIAAAFIVAACAPILPPSSPSSPLPETPAESPSPGGIWSAVESVGDEDIAWLRATGLLLPVRGVQLAKVQESFDAPRDGGRRHDAVDIMAPRGTPILAAIAGTVLRVGANALGGNVIWMADREDRFVFYYAHLERYARGVRQGDHIARGTVIGYVGTTGNAPPDVPHLHFQVMRITDTKRWWNGTPVNPLAFLIEDGSTRVAATPRR